jgi:hypothetical protein
LEQTDNVQDEGQEQTSQEPVTNPENEALLKELEQLRSSNARLLAESKENKAKYKNVLQEKEEEKRRQAEEQGNHAELAESLKNELHKTKAELESERKANLAKELRYEVAKHAKGARDVEDIIDNIGKVAGGIIQIDEDSRSFNGVADAVAKVRETKPYLFDSKPVSGMVDGRPAADVPREKTFDELTSTEKDELFLKAMVAAEKGQSSI